MHTRQQPPRGAIDAMGISITRGRRGQTELSDCGNLQHTDLTQMEWACPFAGQARMIALPSGRGNRGGVGQGAAGRLAPGLQGRKDGPSSHGMAESGVVIGWWRCCFRDCGHLVAGLSLRTWRGVLRLCSAPDARVTFFCFAKRRVTKEKASPVWRPCGVPCATRFRRGLRNSAYGLRQCSPFSRQKLRCSAPHRAGLALSDFCYRHQAGVANSGRRTFNVELNGLRSLSRRSG